MKNKLKKTFLILTPIVVTTAIALPLIITTTIKAKSNNDNNKINKPKTINEDPKNNINDENKKLNNFEYKNENEIQNKKNINLNKEIDKILILLDSNELTLNKLNDESTVDNINNFVLNLENIKSLILNFIKDPKTEFNLKISKLFNKENQDCKIFEYKISLSANKFNTKDLTIEFKIIKKIKNINWKNIDNNFTLTNNILTLNLKDLKNNLSDTNLDKNTLQENIIYQMEQEYSIESLLKNKIENLNVEDKITLNLTKINLNSLDYDVHINRNNVNIKTLKFKIIHKNIFDIKWKNNLQKGFEPFPNKKEILVLDASKYNGIYVDNNFEIKNDSWMGINKGLALLDTIKSISENNKTINGSNTFKKSIMNLLDIEQGITESNLKIELSTIDGFIIIKLLFNKVDYFNKHMFLYIKNFANDTYKKLYWMYGDREFNFDYQNALLTFNVKNSKRKFINELPNNSIINTVKIAMLSNRYNNQILSRIKPYIANNNIIDSKTKLLVKLAKEERETITFELIIRHPNYPNMSLFLKMIALPNFGKATIK